MADRSPSASDPIDQKLIERRVLIFDVYGTLIDWETAIHDAFAPVFPNLTREEILVNYARVEGELQTQFNNTHYAQLLELAYRQLTTGEGTEEQPTSTTNVKEEEISIGAPHSAPDDARRFAGSIAGWKPFPDTIDALHRLKKYFAVVVLSNVDDRSFAETHRKLCTLDYPGSAYRTVTPDSPFSLILTAQHLGAYKPNPVMLESALKQLSAYRDPSLASNPEVCVEASQVLVVANSIRHDIIPAMKRKVRSVWISRHGVNFIGNERDLHSEECRPYSWRYETLGSMAAAVEREAQF